jgi:hypothetical protein
MTKLPGKFLITKLVQPSTFILVGVFGRILPHPANFAPIAAMALFGGTYMGRKQAFILPLLAMIISDFVIGFDSLSMRLTVYGSFSMMVLIGIWLKNHKNIKNVILATLFSSILFFVITNFSVWAFGTMYPKTLAGLTEAYFFAIPFFRNTILGDAVYSGAFFGGYELINIFLHGASVQKA